MAQAWSDGRADGTAARTGGGSAGEPRALRLTIGLAVCATFLFLAGFAVYLASLERSERVPPSQTDGIVALTGGSQRIGDAIDLLSQGFARRLLITGVNERTSRDQIARLNPEKRDLVACCVDLDYRARNTVGNAHEIRRWARQNGFASLIVVTSNYHMPRTLAELDHALPGVRKVPYPVVTSNIDAAAWWQRIATARLLFSEYTKYVAVLLRTRLAATAMADDRTRQEAARVSEIGTIPSTGRSKDAWRDLAVVADPPEAR